KHPPAPHGFPVAAEAGRPSPPPPDYTGPARTTVTPMSCSRRRGNVMIIALESWEEGYRDGIVDSPFQCTPGLDRFSYASGYFQACAHRGHQKLFSRTTLGCQCSEPLNDTVVALGWSSFKLLTRSPRTRRRCARPRPPSTPFPPRGARGE